MNEGKKTGAFCIVGALMLAIGLFLSWPNAAREESSVSPGQPLFENFKDPLTAASLKMVSFDEEQGQVETFEVRRDRESGVWSIPSRKGYPADAVEQMKDAANALVGLQILDVQTRNAEDHEALGVVEPKLEDLEVGDVGVGRLVTFRDDSQKELASLIIGNPLKDEDGKIYVRKPGQDPVYVVNLDESTLSTRFQDWIEEDLLQLSSIDINKMTIKDYAASMTQRGISLTRNYNAEIEADGTDWKLGKLVEFPADNPLADPIPVEVDPTQVLNTEKLNDIKNALDDLKIVDVVRKPDGMSDNLRADKDLISDNEAVSSLASRGFFPVSAGGNGEFEVLSANGELNVSINDGVQYILRFGNVSGLTEDEDQAAEDGDDSSGTGVNRYLLVTTRVDEEQFPAPELSPVPQTIEELAALLGVEATVDAGEEESPMSAPETTATDGDADGDSEEMKADASEPVNTESTPEGEASDKAVEKEAAEGTDEMPASDEAASEPKEASTEKTSTAEQPTAEQPSTEKSAADTNASVDEVEVSGSGEATGEGQGEGDEKTTPQGDQDEAKDTKDDDGELSFAELSDDEKQERLEAEQEKILKENTRRLDERKDRLNAAKRRVRELNARFANWYYVIPENTYRELRIQRDELLTSAESPSPAGPAGQAPLQMDSLNSPK